MHDLRVVTTSNGAGGGGGGGGGGDIYLQIMPNRCQSLPLINTNGPLVTTVKPDLSALGYANENDDAGYDDGSNHNNKQPQFFTTEPPPANCHCKIVWGNGNKFFQNSNSLDNDDSVDDPLSNVTNKSDSSNNCQSSANQITSNTVIPTVTAVLPGSSKPQKNQTVRFNEARPSTTSIKPALTAFIQQKLLTKNEQKKLSPDSDNSLPHGYTAFANKQVVINGCNRKKTRNRPSFRIFSAALSSSATPTPPSTSSPSSPSWQGSSPICLSPSGDDEEGLAPEPGLKFTFPPQSRHIIRSANLITFWPDHTTPTICPICRSTVETNLRYKAGKFAIILSFILAATGVGLLGLFIFPFCCHYCLDIRHHCPVCNELLGVHLRQFPHSLRHFRCVL